MYVLKRDTASWTNFLRERKQASPVLIQQNSFYFSLELKNEPRKRGGVITKQFTEVHENWNFIIQCLIFIINLSPTKIRSFAVNIRSLEWLVFYRKQILLPYQLAINYVFHVGMHRGGIHVQYVQRNTSQKIEAFRKILANYSNSLNLLFISAFTSFSPVFKQTETGSSCYVNSLKICRAGHVTIFQPGD